MSNVIEAANRIEDRPGVFNSETKSDWVQAIFTTFEGAVTTGLTDVATVDGGAGLSTPMRIVSGVSRHDAVDTLVHARRAALR